MNAKSQQKADPPRVETSVVLLWMTNRGRAREYNNADSLVFSKNCRINKGIVTQSKVF